MPDVFISYNREDQHRASAIADALKAEGLEVWWDSHLRAGQSYDEVTEKNLREAGAVVVLWSKRSVNSKWVRAEATIGERCSTLVPAMIEDCDRPLRFELVQTANLQRWHGDRTDPNWRDFIRDIKSAIGQHEAAAAPAAPTPAAPAAAGGGDVTIENTFWTSIKDGTDRSDFDAYLKRYPNGHFADLARNRIAALERAEASAGAAATAAAEAEARRRAEEDQRRRAQEEGERRRAQEEDQRRRAQEDEQRRRAQEDEEQRRRAQDAEDRRRAEDEARRRAAAAQQQQQQRAAAAQQAQRAQAQVQAQSQAQAQAQAQPRQQAAAPAAEKKGGGAMVLIIGAVVLAAVAGAAFFFLSGGGDDEPASAIAAPQDAPPADETPPAVAEAEGPETLTVETAPEEAPPADALAAEEAAAEEIPVEEAPVEEASAPTTFTDCEMCPAMEILPAGTFMMGSPSDEPGRNPWEGPQREVTIAPFALGRTEVTFDQWAACVEDGGCRGYEPSDAGYGRGEKPVIYISFNDAENYVEWLSRKTDRQYRLPTEAEWEYAARGGTDTAYWWGPRFDRAMSNSAPVEVTSLTPNAFGLYGMLGNVTEWVEDCYVNNYTEAPTDGSPVTNGDCSRRVVRGGSFRGDASDMRAANRVRISRTTRDRIQGLRVAADVE